MIFNLNEFLFAVSFALDFVEMDILGVASNHSKRVAYISLKIGEYLDLPKDQLFDLVSLAVLHDNGASEKLLHDKLDKRDKSSLQSIEIIREHGIIGEKNISAYPFLTSVSDAIKFHHENYDGSGFFGLSGDSIPLFSQIIRLADTIELNFPLKDMSLDEKHRLEAFIKAQECVVFSPAISNAFIETSQRTSYWLDMKDLYINTILKRLTPAFSKDLSFREIHNITKVFSGIIDSKSQYTRVHSSELSWKANRMAEYYMKPEDEVYKLMIAADLHDIGKLAVSNDIIDKPGKLDESEFETIKEHPYYTRLSLMEISGFEDITEWASNHHEKLNGTGYPYKKSAVDLDFNSRLIACLDIYQALMEERPYRNAMKHETAYGILHELAGNGAIDKQMVADIDKVFAK